WPCPAVRVARPGVARPGGRAAFRHAGRGSVQRPAPRAVLTFGCLTTDEGRNPALGGPPGGRRICRSEHPDRRAALKGPPGPVRPLPSGTTYPEVSTGHRACRPGRTPDSARPPDAVRPADSGPPGRSGPLGDRGGATEVGSDR